MSMVHDILGRFLCIYNVIVGRPIDVVVKVSLHCCFLFFLNSQHTCSLTMTSTDEPFEATIDRCVLLCSISHELCACVCVGVRVHLVLAIN